MKLGLYYFYFDKNLLLRFNGWRFHFVKSETKKQIIFVLRKNVLVTLNFFVCVGNNCQRFCTAVSLWKKSDQKANYFNFEKMLLLRFSGQRFHFVKSETRKQIIFVLRKNVPAYLHFKLFCLCQRFCTEVSLCKKSDQKTNCFRFEKILLLRFNGWRFHFVKTYRLICIRHFKLFCVCFCAAVSLCKKSDQKTNYFRFEKILLLRFSGWRFHFVKSETKKQIIFVLKLVLYYFRLHKKLTGILNFCQEMTVNGLTL